MARDNDDNYFSLLSARLSVGAGARPLARAGMLLGPLFSPLNSDTSAVRKLLSASAFITRSRNKGTLRMYVVIQLRIECLHLHCSPPEIMTHIRPRGEILINSLHYSPLSVVQAEELQ